MLHAQRQASGDTADIVALLKLGVPLERLEALYGCQEVRAAARRYVKSGKDRQRSTVGQVLITRSVSSKREALEDEQFVTALLASLEEDPDDSLMDPLMLTPMTDPVVLSSGYVVDRTTALHPGGQLRLRQCPFTRVPLEPKVYPVVFLALQIKEWRVKQLQSCIDIAEQLLQMQQTERAEEVFEIAERFLAEVGDTTYVHLARRLAELERSTGAARDPKRLATIYQRLLRVLPTEFPEDRAALVVQAVGEFVQKAETAMDAGDKEGARGWLTDPVVNAWLLSPAVRPLWRPKELEWHTLALQVAKANEEEAEVQLHRLCVYRILSARVVAELAGSQEALDLWLEQEGLEQSMFAAVSAAFTTDHWEYRCGSRQPQWIDEAAQRAQVGPGKFLRYRGPPLHVSVHPHPLYPCSRDNGWSCDARSLEGGCLQGCTGFHQSRGWERWRDADSDFDLCGVCARDKAQPGVSVDDLWTNKSLDPQPNKPWVLEVMYKADSLRAESYKNTVFSSHGSGTGWELRIDRRRGVELVWTTRGGGHNEYCCGLGHETGVWTHVVVVYDPEASTHVIYVNGVGTESHRVSGLFVPYNGPAQVGQNPHWHDRYLQGEVAHSSVRMEWPVAMDQLPHHVRVLAADRLRAASAWEHERLSDSYNSDEDPFNPFNDSDDDDDDDIFY